MRSALTILTFFLLTNFCIGQSNSTFSIRQVSLPNVHISHYKFDGENIVVTENNKKIAKRKLTQTEIKELYAVIQSVGLDTLQERYSRGVLDGISWNFEFDLNGTKKDVYLDNYYLKNLDILVRKVNTYLKKKNRIISFGDDMLSRPDTVIYNLPDFYLDLINLPDKYSFYWIDCYSEGYFVTKILDLIELCDCRIYPMNNNGNLKERNYWRAVRLDGNSWKREYFDNNSQVFKTELIQDIIPYSIVEEIVHTDIGNKPSVTIYRYYRTFISPERTNIR